MTDTQTQPPAGPPDSQSAWARLGLPGPVDTPAPPKPPSRARRLLLGAAALVSVCLCAGVALCVWTFTATDRETPAVVRVIDEFMTAMADREVEAAYALYSTRAIRQIELEALEEMAAGHNGALFSHYASVFIGTINIGPSFNSDPNLPQGTVANVIGTIRYSNGYTGQFEAVLEKEANAWRLDYIHINVPIEKLDEATEPRG